MLAAAEAVVILVLAVLFLARPAVTEPVAHAPAAGVLATESDSPAVAPTVLPAPSMPQTGAPAAIGETAWSPDDPTGIVVHGSITDTEGVPLEGVTVSFAPPFLRRAIVASTRGGGYAAAGLVPGAWKVRGRAEGFRDLELEYTVAPRSPQRLDLQLQRALRVLVEIVTPEGKPLHDALDALQRQRGIAWGVEVGAVATREPPAGDLPLTEYASMWGYGLGEWRPSHGRNAVQDHEREPVPEEYAGVLDVDGEPPLFVSAVMRHVLLATAPLARGQREVTLTVPLAMLLGKLCGVRLRVLDDATGQPLADARVALHDRNSHISGMPVREDGTILLEHQRPGLLVLQVQAKGYETLREYVRLAPGQVDDLGEIRLGRPVSIKGVVVEAQGKPVQARTQYRRVDRIGFAQPWDLDMLLQGAGGEFALGHVGPGRYVITAADEGRAGHAVADTLAGPVADLRVVLLPATMVELENKGSREAGYFVLVRDAQGTLVQGARLVGGRDDSLALPPGRYTLDVHDSHRLLRSEAIVAAGQPLAVRIP
jgi:protocatechuate 3,4-dioxygenase beta subunit